ncbi:MAG: hypothetical protein D6740_07605, partial [Alphaproteobacteria bacterium]
GLIDGGRGGDGLPLACGTLLKQFLENLGRDVLSMDRGSRWQRKCGQHGQKYQTGCRDPLWKAQRFFTEM